MASKKDPDIEAARLYRQTRIDNGGWAQGWDFNDVVTRAKPRSPDQIIEERNSVLIGGFTGSLRQDAPHDAEQSKIAKMMGEFLAKHQQSLQNYAAFLNIKKTHYNTMSKRTHAEYTKYLNESQQLVLRTIQDFTAIADGKNLNLSAASMQAWTKDFSLTDSLAGVLAFANGKKEDLYVGTVNPALAKTLEKAFSAVYPIIRELQEIGWRQTRKKSAALT